MILLNSNVNFTCTAIAKPRAVVNWFRNNSLLMQSFYNENHIVIITNSMVGNCSITDFPSQCVSSSTLQILNARAVDSGEYTCVAINEAGSDSFFNC